MMRLLQKTSRNSVCRCWCRLWRFNWQGGRLDAHSLCEEDRVDSLVQGGIGVSTDLFYLVLQRCKKEKDLVGTRKVHGRIVESGYECDAYLGNHLIRAYSSCGSLVDAKGVFGKLAAPNRYAWAAIISAHGKEGQADQVIRLYHRMVESGVKPGDDTHVSVLKACGDVAALASGKLVHGAIVECGSEMKLRVGTALVDMYAKCGSFSDARTVFEGLVEKDQVAWSAMISGYAKCGLGREAVELFEQMVTSGVQPDEVTVPSILKACAMTQSLEHGKLVHSHALSCGFQASLFVASTLIDMYWKCGSLEDARTVFDGLSQRDGVAWTVMIAGCVSNGFGEEALQLFEQMQVEGVAADKVMVSAILKACSSVGALDHGRLVHALIDDRGYGDDVSVASTLIDMYAKCGRVDEGRRVFDSLSRKDEVTWNAMILGHAENGDDESAFELFQKMQAEDMCPNSATVVSVLKSCSRMGSLDAGKLVHAGYGYDECEDVLVGNSLMDMYARCGSLEDAGRVFERLSGWGRDLVSWNTMIAGCVAHARGHQALELYHACQEEGLQADEVTFASVLKACSVCGALDEGRLIHRDITQRGYGSQTVIATALVDMYAKCGSVEDAGAVFHNLSTSDLVSWNAIIAAYASHSGHARVALKLYQQLLKAGLHPNRATLLSTLRACSTSCALAQGKAIHAHITGTGLDADTALGSALIHMYATCGDLKSARRVFDRLSTKAVVSWNVMIAGYAQLGAAEQALQLFHQMQEQGQQPDKFTFASLLSACSHAALLDEAHGIFGSMLRDYGIVPEMEHYAGMVDVLGRAGQLLEVEALIAEMPSEPDVCVWTSVLGACQTHGNLELAKRAFDAIMMLDPRLASAYVLMANIFAAAGRWEDAAEVRRTMRIAGVKKQPGRTWVEIGNQVHNFMVADTHYPETEQVHDVLGVLAHMIKQQPAETGVSTPHSSSSFFRPNSRSFSTAARQRLNRGDVLSWTAHISESNECGQFRKALKRYEKMREVGVMPSTYTFLAVLKACSSLGDIETGKQIHGHVIESGVESQEYVGTTLVSMYAKCGSMLDAGLVFHKLRRRHVSSWTAMILGHAQNDEGDLALELFERMRQEGVAPDTRTYVGALKACASLAGRDSELNRKCLEKGKSIHSELVTRGFESDVFVGTTLVDMYAKCGSMVDARQVFDALPHRNVVSWNAMILGYAQNEEGELALELYGQMEGKGVSPDGRSFVGALKACGILAALEEGAEVHGKLIKVGCLEKVKSIHDQLVKGGFQSDVFAGTTLVDMYAKCGSMLDARHVFDALPRKDVVSWNAMILGYAQNEGGMSALELYGLMGRTGVAPDGRTFVGALKACSSLAALEEGRLVDGKIVKLKCLERCKCIHCELENRGFGSDVFVGTTLVDAYAKCGSMVDARHVFDKLPHRNLVSWSTMISGYAQNEEGSLALELYSQMEREGVTPDGRVLAGVLKACGSLAALDKGKEIHAHIQSVGTEAADVIVATGLIDMYGKCGSMVDAQQVFDALPTKNLVTWNALIAGYARQGESGAVFRSFESMKLQGFEPDKVTFLCVLTACSHGGLVDEGNKYFESMRRDFGIHPNVEHYICLVDLLGRAGQVVEAVAIVKTMPFQPNLVAWTAVLGACRKWNNVEIGRYAFERAVRLDDKYSTSYMLLSNIYGDAQMWDDRDDIRAMRKNARAWKELGRSWWPEIGGMVHTFVVGDKRHPHSQDIYAKLKELCAKL